MVDLDTLSKNQEIKFRDGRFGCVVGIEKDVDYSYTPYIIHFYYVTDELEDVGMAEIVHRKYDKNGNINPFGETSRDIIAINQQRIKIKEESFGLF